MTAASAPELIVVMGVSGSGKSTLACALAEKLTLSFIEADDFHSEQAKQQMAAGIALDDEMRAPWINRLADALTVVRQQGKSCVLAYSGLRRRHRQVFREIGFATTFIYLKLPKASLAKRLQARQSHFFHAALLDSQLADLQTPLNEPDIHEVSAEQPLSWLLTLCENILKTGETSYA